MSELRDVFVTALIFGGFAFCLAGILYGDGGNILGGGFACFVGLGFIFSQIEDEKSKRLRNERLAQEAQKPGWMR